MRIHHTHTCLPHAYSVIQNDMFKFSDRGQRRTEKAVERQVGEQEQPRAKPKPKSKPKKNVSAEMQERQKRAAARMLELKVPPLQVRIS